MKEKDIDLEFEELFKDEFKDSDIHKKNVIQNWVDKENLTETIIPLNDKKDEDIKNVEKDEKNENDEKDEFESLEEHTEMKDSVVEEDLEELLNWVSDLEEDKDDTKSTIPEKLADTLNKQEQFTKEESNIELPAMSLNNSWEWFNKEDKDKVNKEQIISNKIKNTLSNNKGWEVSKSLETNKGKTISKFNKNSLILVITSFLFWIWISFLFLNQTQRLI